MIKKISLFVALFFLIRLLTVSSVNALQWPGPSTDLSTGYGWRAHPIATETVVEWANPDLTFAIGNPIWNQRATLQWHNGIDIRGKNKLKAVEDDTISYILLETQDLESGVVRDRSTGVSINGNRILGNKWGYLHLSNSEEPDWKIGKAKGWDERAQDYTIDVNYVDIQVGSNKIYYSTNSKIQLPSGDKKDAKTSLTEGEYFALSGSTGRSTGPHLHLIHYGGDPTKSPLVDLYNASGAPKNFGTPFVTLPYYDDVTKMVLSLAGSWDGELDLNKFNVLADGTSVHEVSFSPRLNSKRDHISDGTKTGILPYGTNAGGQYLIYKLSQGTCSFSGSGLHSIAISATDAGGNEGTSRPLPVGIFPSISCPGGGHPDDNFSVSDPTDLPGDEEYDGDPIWITPSVAILKDGFVPEMGNLLTQRRIRYTFKPVDVSSFDLGTTDLIIIPSGGLHGLWNSDVFKKGLDDYVKAGGKIIVFSQPHGYEYSALPTPDGNPITAYGWEEDQNCQYQSSYIDTWHQMLSSISQLNPSINVDGYFTSSFEQHGIVEAHGEWPACCAYVSAWIGVGNRHIILH